MGRIMSKQKTTIPKIITDWPALLLLALLLVACSEEAAPEPVAAATATAAPVVIVVPTATPAEAAIEASASDPTPTATEAVASVHDHGETHAGGSATTPANEPAAPDASVSVSTVVTTSHEAPDAGPLSAASSTAPNQPRVAVLRFSDSEYMRAGSFTILSSNLPPAPAGSHYDLWLTQGEQPRFRLGSIPSQASQLNFTGNTDQPLSAIYDGALLTLEPDVDTPGEVGPVLFQGAVPAAARLHILQVTDRFADNPGQQGFLLGAQEQLQLAREHAEFLRNALVDGALAEAHRHAEHVVNILNGEAGEIFGDLDRDGVPQNPGDGVGVLGYLAGAKVHTDLAANAGDATAEVMLHAGHTLVSSDNASAWVAEAVADALRVLSADSPGEAQAWADSLVAGLDLVRDGVDADGDGAVAPIVGEGGLLTAYEHALYMGAVELYPVGDILALSAAPPVLEPTPTPVSPPPAVALVEMSDFAFDQPELTIKAGTVVTWVNRGAKPHSATADDGSFDTGLFDPGERAAAIFDTPGTYRYFCALHGGSGGQGMAGTIVVTE
jgi:plastocyanin